MLVFKNKKLLYLYHEIKAAQFFRVLLIIETGQDKQQ